MELIEREEPLNLLRTLFQNVEEEGGHCVFINGEAGIGKTSLVKEFANGIKNRCQLFQGTCDALFTPRPLAPLYDVLLQLQNKFPETSRIVVDRDVLFGQLFYELKNLDQTSVLLFEDIHWADEATLDFIKFLSRRITQLPCLFILTYRDTEIHSHHPLTTVLGQLNADSFTRLHLLPFSKQTVEKMADEKGYKGEDVYAISGGNPFYVNEILASYSLGVPENIKDSILSTYNRVDEDKKHVWQILSVLPTGFEVKYLETMEPSYAATIHSCLELKLLVIKDGLIFFKHELFRRIIESSLSPFLRIELNKRILHLFKDSFETNGQVERIVHHAKAGNANEEVVYYAPLAARQAGKLGAHKQASKLYLTAIEYYQGNDVSTLISLYESYAYECYLTNQIKEAIIYTGKINRLLEEEYDIEKKGDCLRLLSRLWWLEGNKSRSEAYAIEAMNLLAGEPSSTAKAMSLSNMSQLRMLSDELEECIYFGEKAIQMAKDLNDERILCHALNNVGTALSRILSSRQKGNALLEQSLEIALRNSYQEDVARAYTNLGSSAVIMKEYAYAKKVLEAGIEYGEEKDLNTWTMFLFSELARLYLETGQWDQAIKIAERVLLDETQGRLSKTEALIVLAKIKLRRGDGDPLQLLLDAKAAAVEMKELPSMIPALTGLLEYEWITGTRVVDREVLQLTMSLVEQKGDVFGNSEFAFWLSKVRNQSVQLKEFFGGYQSSTLAKSVAVWKSLDCPYEQALLLFEGSLQDKRQALDIMDKLGATAVFEKMKFIMRTSGIRQLPRGIRKTTRANAANLTLRELDVLHFLREGLQNKDISKRLFISPKTVDHHISSILFKLDVDSRIKAVKQAIELELIK
jgi:DNA-binding CsgD family transcriptional regulator